MCPKIPQTELFIIVTQPIKTTELTIFSPKGNILFVQKTIYWLRDPQFLREKQRKGK